MKIHNPRSFINFVYMKRLFAAIKINPTDAFTSRYWSLKTQLKDEKIRWVDPDNFHITLKFFGETPEHHIPAISVALRQSTEEISAFQISLSEIGIFGSSYNPRVIWIGVEAPPALPDLFGNILRNLAEIGIEKDRQNFVAHLSLGRMKNIEDKKHFQQIIDKNRSGHIQKEEVKNFHLFESILKPTGPEYNILETYPLE